MRINLSRPALLVLVLGALSLTARADDWTHTYPLTGQPTLDVSTNDGNITVEPGKDKAVEISIFTEGVRIGDGGVEIIESQQGNTVHLEARLPRHIVFGFSRSRRLDITVRMPRRAVLQLESEDGNLNVDGIGGELRLHTSDGALLVRDSDGSLEANTSDGRIDVDGRFDSLHLRTSDGSIRAEAYAGSRLASDWSVRTSDGSIRLGLPQDLAADLETWTGDGHVDIEIPVVVSGRMSENHQRGRLNGGGNLLTLRTSDGSIEVYPSREARN